MRNEGTCRNGIESKDFFNLNCIEKHSLYAMAAMKRRPRLPFLNRRAPNPAVAKSKAIHMQELPIEIVTKIFEYLSPSDILRCARVCHGWLEASAGSEIWRFHFLKLPKKIQSISAEAKKAKTGVNWKTETIICLKKARKKKLALLLKKISPYTGLPEKTSAALKFLDVTWSLVFTDCHKGKEFEKNATLLGKDQFVSLYYHQPGFVFGIWHDKALKKCSIAFVTLYISLRDIFDRILKGSTERFFTCLEHETIPNDVDSKYGLQRYSALIELRTNRKLLWDFKVQEFYKAEREDGLLIMTDKRPVYLGSFDIPKSIRFPWRSGSIKGIIKNVAVIDFILTDENKDFIWVASQPVAASSHSETQIEFDDDANEKLVMSLADDERGTDSKSDACTVRMIEIVQHADSCLKKSDHGSNGPRMDGPRQAGLSGNPAKNDSFVPSLSSTGQKGNTSSPEDTVIGYKQTNSHGKHFMSTLKEGISCNLQQKSKKSLSEVLGKRSSPSGNLSHHLMENRKRIKISSSPFEKSSSIAAGILSENGKLSPGDVMPRTPNVSFQNTKATNRAQQTVDLSKGVPLAEQLRPRSFEEYFGQSEALGENSSTRMLLQSNKIPSVILWGPPGCGKTSLVNIITANCKKGQAKRVVTLSATTSGINDVKEAVKVAKNELAMFKRETVLFIDEIHRFNKLQQDFFLPHVENGTITLIGATTENPSFHVNNALLSRCKVIVLQKHTSDSVCKILEQAVSKLGGAFDNDVQNAR
eukprot:gene18871-20771_t